MTKIFSTQFIIKTDRPGTLHYPWFLLTFLAIVLLAACTQSESVPAAPTPAPTPDYTNPRITVVAEGLLGPIGMAEDPGGGILIAEEGSGQRDESAGVSLITPTGEVGRLIRGLPSTLDAGDLAGVPLVALAPDRSLLYVANFGQGHLWTVPLTAEQQARGFTIPEQPLTPADLQPTMMPFNNVFLLNPFDMTFTDEGTPVVSDASANGIAIMTADGRTRFFHRFDKLPNPVLPTDSIEAVPTGIERLGENEFLVTLTGGCPYPEGGGQLVAIDMQRNQRTLVEGLNMPIDVVRGADGTLWLLEFARFTPGASCFDGSGYLPETGRLSRVLPDWSLAPVFTDLNFPGAVLPASDGTLYISEVLTGRILHISFEKDP